MAGVVQKAPCMQASACHVPWVLHRNGKTARANMLCTIQDWVHTETCEADECLNKESIVGDGIVDFRGKLLTMRDRVLWHCEEIDHHHSIHIYI